MNIKIINDNSLQNLSTGATSFGNRKLLCKKLSLNDNPYKEVFKISPWHPEHYSCLVLYKFKIWAEKQNIRVVSQGNINYLPALCQISDEIYLQVPDVQISELLDNWFGDGSCKKCKSQVILKQVWYCNDCKQIFDCPTCPIDEKHCSYGFNVGFCKNCESFIHVSDIIASATHNSVFSDEPNFKNRSGKYVDVVKDHTFNNISLGGDCDEYLKIAAREISDEEVVERFWNAEICILESSYNKFLEVKDTLPRDVIMLVVKEIRYPIEKLVGLNLPVLPREYQREIVRQAGFNYMSFQVLGSEFLNWFFVSNRGSSAILSMLPVKNILLSDVGVYPYKNIVNGFSERRFGIKDVPFVEDHRALSWHSGHVELHDYLNVNKDRINYFIEKNMDKKTFSFSTAPKLRTTNRNEILTIRELEEKSSLPNKCTALMATCQSSIEFFAISVFSLLCNSNPNLLEHINFGINGPDKRTGNPSLQDKKQTFLEELRELKWHSKDMPITVSRVWSRVGHGECIDSLIPWVHTSHYLLMHDDIIILNKDWLDEGLEKFKLNRNLAILLPLPSMNPVLVTQFNEGWKLGLPHPNTSFVLCDKSIINDLGVKWRGYHVQHDFEVNEELIDYYKNYGPSSTMDKMRTTRLNYFNMDIGAEVIKKCNDKMLDHSTFNDSDVFHCQGMSWLTDKWRIENKLKTITPMVADLKNKIIEMDERGLLSGGYKLFDKYVKLN